jgi:hypothetical protein
MALPAMSSVATGSGIRAAQSTTPARATVAYASYGQTPLPGTKGAASGDPLFKAAQNGASPALRGDQYRARVQIMLARCRRVVAADLR